MSSHLFTYAIGDIYGDHALLTTLLDRIHDHADGEDYRLVFLGNTIDHGPNGNAVLSALRSMELRAPDRVVTLRGWHEAMMAQARGDEEAFATWLRNGGETTLRSFGARRHAELPREVVDWIARRPSEYRDGLRRFVSAASTADEQQDPAATGLHVVHGSSTARTAGQENKPLEQIGRTDVDTGAGFGGCLTAAIFTDLQASPAGFFQALPDGSTRFLPPSRAVAQPWDPRLALKLTGEEPESAAAWSLRQDADLVAARIAQKKRESRRRTALAAAAGVVVVVGGAGLLIRPAMTYLARSMAPAGTTPQVAAGPGPAGATAESVAEAPATLPEAGVPGSSTATERASAEPGASQTASAPDPAGEVALRTHALPASPDGTADAVAVQPPRQDPAATAATTPAPEPAGSPIQDQNAVPLAAATPVPALPAVPQPDAPAVPAVSPGATPAQDETEPGRGPALPALAMADSGVISDGGGQPFVLPQASPAAMGVSAFALALEPSRRLGWNAGGPDPADRGLARPVPAREASVGQPVPVPDVISDETAKAPAAVAVQKPAAKPKPKPKPRVAVVPRPVKRVAPAPKPSVEDVVQENGPIDLRALMDAPQAPTRPRKRTAPRPAPAVDPAFEPDAAGQP